MALTLKTYLLMVFASIASCLCSGCVAIEETTLRAEEQIELEYNQACEMYWRLRVNRALLEGDTSILCEIEEALKKEMAQLLDRMEHLSPKTPNSEQQDKEVENSTNI